ncbi:MAG: DUF4124 domain-containing protein [Gammaproteobacteria bacterium]|nr:DUF4124 domain-containing protein [Gammaproteobacteria bacterium]
MKQTSLLTCLFVLLTATVEAAPERVFKWVDQNGVIHYGDILNNRANQGRHAVLNSQGVTIKQINAIATPAELAAKEETKKRHEIQLARQEQQRRSDQILLTTFTTERDLLLARNGRLDSIDSTIQLNQRRLDSIERQLQDLRKMLIRLDVREKQSTQHLLKQQAHLEKQQSKLEQALSEKQHEHNNLARKFDRDLLRFRELQANPAAP